MIDTHAHLDFENFDEDREEVIRRAFDNGVKAVVNIGVDLKCSRKSIEIAEKYDRVFASVGMHPEYFSKGDWGDLGNKEDWIEKLKKLAEHEKVVAVGETGLDYFRVGESGEIGEIRERQKKGFVAQIEIAQELNLPVIVHCRDAWRDLYEIISNFSQSSAFPSASSADSSKPSFSKFALHCYAGSKEDTEKFLKLDNVYFSFSGNITYPKPADRADELAQAVQMIPLDKIMLDSDSPFLAPQAMRGKRNEPANIRFIAEKIAQIKEISGEEVEKATDENAERFFEIRKLEKRG